MVVPSERQTPLLAQSLSSLQELRQKPNAQVPSAQATLGPHTLPTVVLEEEDWSMLFSLSQWRSDAERRNKEAREAKRDSGERESTAGVMVARLRSEREASRPKAHRRRLLRRGVMGELRPFFRRMF